MKFQFTHNNHYYYDLDGDPWAYRTSPFQQLNIHCGSVDWDLYRRGNYNSELKRIADIQWQYLNGDITIFLSGGSDSEIVARSFKNIGVKPRLLTVKFENGYNDFEVAEAQAVADELDLPLEIYNFDVKEFVYSGNALEFGKQIQCSYLSFLILSKVIHDIKRPSIMGGELQMTKFIDFDTSQWHLRAVEYLDLVHMKLAQQIDVPIISEWFYYTPEIMLYYLEQPELEDLVYNPLNYKLSITSIKNKILKRLVPELRIKEKRTGFEKLQGLNNEFHTLMAAELPRIAARAQQGLSYMELIKTLKGY